MNRDTRIQNAPAGADRRRTLAHRPASADPSLTTAARSIPTPTTA
ncbi:hypothetical protein ACIQU6_06910 [Streptomyces sp. NPDC090442]